ncbi:helix-turn-helix domain-containing protein [Micromonospora sp. NPDC050397]|uniref:helix-turn-helix domain-containing protein n=1 Tax=Micromonospora sp. NPDC050397 TaxID=3364279 RepID=UPI00384F23EA
MLRSRSTGAAPTRRRGPRRARPSCPHRSPDPTTNQRTTAGAPGAGRRRVLPGPTQFHTNLLETSLMATPQRRQSAHPSQTITPAPSTPPTQDSEVLLYTPAEAAQRLQVRESWLRKKAAARQVPCTFLGKHLRFSPADLAAIIANSARPATGRRPRRKPPTTVRDRDLPPPAERSVHAHPDDHTSHGSSPWRG